jgi:hypothetical protein
MSAPAATTSRSHAQRSAPVAIPGRPAGPTTSASSAPPSGPDDGSAPRSASP